MLPDNSNPPDFRASLPESCEVVVIGAGPAGLIAANHLASLKVGRVVLLDRRDPWREPVACAEGVRRPDLEAVSPLAIAPWIRTHIDHLRVATETASFVWTRRGDGLIIDRTRMHKDLARAAADAGVLCHFRARATKVGPLVDDRRTVEVEVDGVKKIVRARAVIDASGPGKGFGHEEGIADGTADLETAAFVMVEGLESRSDTISIIYSKRFAPGGYAWIFPSSAGQDNVGVVCGRKSGLSSRQGLALFLEHLKSPKVIGGAHGGAIPCGSGSGIIAQDMLFKAGDAASMVHPLSRAGIVEAMESGKMAAVAVMDALYAETAYFRQRAHRNFAKYWRNRHGKAHRQAQRIKPLLSLVPDAFWSRIFAELNQAPTTRRLHHQVAFTVMKALPSAILAAIRA
jgi:digeranylgeranylglycerophospholipid reductase